MKKYKCHKVVWAMKIVGFDFPPKGEESKGVLLLGQEHNEFVSQEYFNHHTPEVGGYYVKYSDGYESYSPAKAFEEGYSEIPSDEKVYKKIDNNFMYHSPIGDQPKKYSAIRGIGKEIAYLIEALVPDSREKSLAMTKLEEAVMWANAGIARNTPNKEAD